MPMPPTGDQAPNRELMLSQPSRPGQAGVVTGRRKKCLGRKEGGKCTWGSTGSVRRRVDLASVVNMVDLASGSAFVCLAVRCLRKLSQVRSVLY